MNSAWPVYDLCHKIISAFPPTPGNQTACSLPASNSFPLSSLCTEPRRIPVRFRHDTIPFMKAKPISQVAPRIRAAIMSIPRGMVSSYGAVARAAGLPRSQACRPRAWAIPGTSLASRGGCRRPHRHPRRGRSGPAVSSGDGRGKVQRQKSPYGGLRIQVSPEVVRPSRQAHAQLSEGPCKNQKEKMNRN